MSAMTEHCTSSGSLSSTVSTGSRGKCLGLPGEIYFVIHGQQADDVSRIWIRSRKAVEKVS